MWFIQNLFLFICNIQRRAQIKDNVQSHKNIQKRDNNYYVVKLIKDIMSG